jgi:NADP-dependent 3-hydroxy acid dehydrogenase YdfG
MDLRDRVTWITGASSGIGEALIAQLVARGARVAISARREERLRTLAHAWRTRGADVAAFPLNVIDRAANATTVAAIEAALGPIDLAIFNAGGHLKGSGRRFDGRQYVDIMELNYCGVVYGLEAVLPGMLERRRGHVAGVASLTGYRPIPTAGAYGASKAALIHMLDAIRFDLEPRGIAVTVVNPGFVKTPLTDRNRFPMPFLMPVDRAAEIIVSGLERERREVHFPKRLSWTLKAMRVLPYPLYEWIIGAATASRRAVHERSLTN